MAILKGHSLPAWGEASSIEPGALASAPAQESLGPEEALALQGFLDFVQIDDEGDQYYPGFEIW